jgi:hypothetical protein
VPWLSPPEQSGSLDLGVSPSAVALQGHLRGKNVFYSHNLKKIIKNETIQSLEDL